MRYIVAQDHGLAGLIDDKRMYYMDVVFGASESQYKHKYIIDCKIDSEKKLTFIVGHNNQVKDLIYNCMSSHSNVRFFGDADIIILITCNFGDIKANERWTRIFQNKLFRLKSDYWGGLTRISEYNGIPFKATAFEAALFRNKEIHTFEKFWGVADKYLERIM